MSPDGMMVLLGWARDADGDCQQFTGDRIHQRAGEWCHDRLTRNIPVLVTYLCRIRQTDVTIGMGIVPDAVVPMLTYLREPDYLDDHGGNSLSLSTWLVYDHSEDA